MSRKYFADIKAMISFSADGPQPQVLFAEGYLKVLAAGLQAGQKIPIHPEGLIIYTFLEGKGWMVVDGDRLLVGPGACVIALAGAQRGIEADERLIFLASRLYK